MQSPAGWEEPGQKPEFDEFTVVLKGMLRVKTATQTLDVRAGQAVIVDRGEWVQYSSPEADGAEYIAVCLPAFSPDTVHRDADELRRLEEKLLRETNGLFAFTAKRCKEISQAWSAVRDMPGIIQARPRTPTGARLKLT